MQRISMVALRATARQVIREVALVGAANVQAHSDRRAEKTAEAAKFEVRCVRAKPRRRLPPLQLRARCLGSPARGRRRSPPLAH